MLCKKIQSSGWCPEGSDKGCQRSGSGSDDGCQREGPGLLRTCQVTVDRSSLGIHGLASSEELQLISNRITFTDPCFFVEVAIGRPALFVLGHG